MTKEKNLRAIGDHIEDLIQEIGQIADPHVRDQAEELVRSVMDLYGAALARVCEIAGERSSDDDGLIHRLAEDDLIASLLILHGLHPLAVETRIERALDRVRPYLGSHGGDVKLLGVRQGIASLRLEGNCHGCPSSTLTMKLAIEKAIEEAAPEVTHIKVAEELQIDAATLFDGTEAAHTGTRSDSGAWIEIADLPKLADDHLMGRRVAGIDVILCRLGETFFAYQDSCPSCQAALRIGGLQQGILTCSSCGRGFDVRRAGQAVDASGLHMEPLPLLGREGGLRVAIPGLYT
jgi:Fe-S cluster biogenesis protein NfuA/nitrite reductase/ring-hydroxylating ferredoxin subunit